MNADRFKIPVLAIFWMVGCHRAPGPVIDPEMAARIPSSSSLMAGVDLERLRGTPLYSKVPVDREGRLLLLGYDGKSVTVVSRGSDGKVSVTGPGGGPAPAALLADAAVVAPGCAIWVVSRGGSVPIPNVNRLLRETESASVAVKVDGLVNATFTGLARSPEAAVRLEETLRASITLAAAGNSRQPDFVAMLRAIRIERDGRTVNASVSASSEQIAKLLP